MNSTADAGEMLDNTNGGGFGYGLGLSIGVLLLITTITFLSYFCTRTHLPDAPSAQSPHESPDQQYITVEVGLDEATLLSYPEFLYSQVKLQNKDTTASCCSICLADYKGTDMIRLLPDCRHIFHLKCIDPWLRLHPTCPVCRTSPIPTPLAEVIPLASR